MSKTQHDGVCSTDADMLIGLLIITDLPDLVLPVAPELVLGDQFLDNRFAFFFTVENVIVSCSAGLKIAIYDYE